MALPPWPIVVVAPAEGEPYAGEGFGNPEGYCAPKIGKHAFPDVMRRGTPRDVARILLADGHPPSETFTITTDSGVLLFTGNLGEAAK